MQTRRDGVPQSGPIRCISPADACCKDPCIDAVRLEALAGFVLCLPQAVVFSQLLGSPGFDQVKPQTELPQPCVQVFFAHLHRAKRCVPLLLPRFGFYVYIFHCDVGKRHDLKKVGHDAEFGLPPASGRWWKASLPPQSVLVSTRAAPSAKPPRASHAVPRLHGRFDVYWCLCHDVHYCVSCADHAVALELASGINTYHEWLVRGFWLIVQLYIENAELVPHWACLTSLEQYACFRRGTWH